MRQDRPWGKRRNGRGAGIYDVGTGVTASVRGEGRCRRGLGPVGQLPGALTAPIVHEPCTQAPLRKRFFSQVVSPAEKDEAAEVVFRLVSRHAAWSFAGGGGWGDVTGLGSPPLFSRGGPPSPSVTSWSLRWHFFLKTGLQHLQRFRAPGQEGSRAPFPGDTPSGLPSPAGEPLP